MSIFILLTGILTQPCLFFFFICNQNCSSKYKVHMNKPHKFQNVFPQFATATQPALLCVISTQDQVMAEHIFRNILLLTVLPFFMWFLPIGSNLSIYKGTGLELRMHSWQLPVHLMKKWSKVIVWHTVQLLLTDCRVFLIFSKSTGLEGLERSGCLKTKFE